VRGGTLLSSGFDDGTGVGIGRWSCWPRCTRIAVGIPGVRYTDDAFFAATGVPLLWEGEWATAAALALAAAALWYDGIGAVFVCTAPAAEELDDA
jgi:hypothetical protein